MGVDRIHEIGDRASEGQATGMSYAPLSVLCNTGRTLIMLHMAPESFC